MDETDIIRFERAQTLLTDALAVRLKSLEIAVAENGPDSLQALLIRQETANLEDMRHFLQLGDQEMVARVIAGLG